MKTYCSPIPNCLRTQVGNRITYQMLVSNIMNTHKILPGLFAILLAFTACKEQEGMSPVNTNDKQPVKVSNVEVENLPGGAKISYTLPTSENILYIKAIYEIRDGVEQEVKSRSEEHTSELQSLMRNSYAFVCLKKTKKQTTAKHSTQ